MTAPKYRDEIRDRLTEIKKQCAYQMTLELRKANRDNPLPYVADTLTYDKYKNFLTHEEMRRIFLTVPD